MTAAAVIVLRKKRPDLDRPYHTLGYPFVPVLFILGGICLVILHPLLTVRVSLSWNWADFAWITFLFLLEETEALRDARCRDRACPAPATDRGRLAGTKPPRRYFCIAIGPQIPSLVLKINSDWYLNQVYTEVIQIDFLGYRPRQRPCQGWPGGPVRWMSPRFSPN